MKEGVVAGRGRGWDLLVPGVPLGFHGEDRGRWAQLTWSWVVGGRDMNAICASERAWGPAPVGESACSKLEQGGDSLSTLSKSPAGRAASTCLGRG